MYFICSVSQLGYMSRLALPMRNVPPLLSHRSLYAVSFDGYTVTIMRRLGAFCKSRMSRSL